MDKLGEDKRAILLRALGWDGAVGYTTGTNGNGGILTDNATARQILEEMSEAEITASYVRYTTPEDIPLDVRQWLADADYLPEEFYPLLRVEESEIDAAGYLTGLRSGLLIGDF